MFSSIYIEEGSPIGSIKCVNSVQIYFFFYLNGRRNPIGLKKKKSLEFGAILMRTGWMNIILSKARMVTGRNFYEILREFGNVF